jgi:sugar-specific transcriptional regulator TrmB
LGEESVEKILKDLGLTEKEVEVYVFLAKHGILKPLDVARQIKKDKAQVLRILKSLQSKGFAEATLEAPKRFTAVQLEKVLDAFVKARRDEAAQIENAKKTLLLYWKPVDKTGPEAPLEKFVVVEGTNKIYSKISQMITETKSDLSTTSTVSGLLRASQMGMFDLVARHPLRSEIKLRFLTELSSRSSNAFNVLLEKALKAGINFRGKNPDVGLRPFPRMVIRDEEEVLLFITPSTVSPRENLVDTGLWTNCKTLVQTFASVFEDLWRNASDTQQKTVTAEAGRFLPKTFLLAKEETIRKKYEEILHSAKKEIIFMTSAQGLIDLSKNMTRVKDWTERGISVRIIAPTTVENLNAIQQLSKFCDIRHAPESRMITITVDETHLFQFKKRPLNEQALEEKQELAFYTSDFEQVAKTKRVLDDVWRSAQPTSAVTIESILNPPTLPADPFRDVTDNPYTKGWMFDEIARGTLTEKDVLNKILNAKRIIAKDPRKDINVLCGSNAHAVIHPPAHFNLPDMMISPWHCDKQSSWGAEDWLNVSLWLETPKGCRYVPVGHVTDNADGLEFRKGVYAGTPAGSNCQLLGKDQFYVQVHGNTLFAGWTVPIPLLPPSYILPPSCILFEGYGELRTCVNRMRAISGRTQVTEANQFSAFVTFFHPASKYSGPGTDAVFNRDVYFTAYPPT